MEIRIIGTECEIEDFVYIIHQIEKDCSYEVSKLSRLYPADNGFYRLYITFSLNCDKPCKINLSKDKSGGQADLYIKNFNERSAKK